MSEGKGNSTRLQKPSSGSRPASSLAIALRAFDALASASADEPILRKGREALPRSEGEARARGLRMIEILEERGAQAPDRLVLVELARAADADEKAWHVAPVYRVQMGAGPVLEAVTDPFLRHAPIGIAEWSQQLKVTRTAFLDPAEMLEARDAMENAPDTLEEDRSPHATTRRGGQGTEADGHGLARLMRAWLRSPEEDASHVARFRSLFGETAWRAFVSAYPKLMAAVDAEMPKRQKR